MAHKILTSVGSVLFAVLSFSGFGQQAEQFLENSSITIGQQIGLSVEFTLPGGWPSGEMPESFWPIEAVDTLTAQVEIIERSDIEQDTVKGDLIVHQDLIITSFDTGFVVIPPVRFQLADQTIESNALLLQVTQPTLDESGLRQNKASREVHYTWFDRIMEQIGWIIAAVLLVVVIALWLRYRKKQTDSDVSEPTPEVPRDPPHIEALNALEKLRQKQLWQNEQGKAYQTELTDILRTYVERRYSVSTFERTTREILADLKLCGLPSDAFARLKATLELADMVKFAKYSALPNEHEQGMSNAELIIHATQTEPESHE